jgi:hypothetical protein
MHSSRNPPAMQNRPPQFNSNVEVVHRYRFLSTSGTSTAITSQSLLLAAGSVCYAANANVVSFFGSVKVQSVSVWSPPASQGSASTCSVDWEGLANSPNREVSDSSVSVATPARIVSAPPPMSLASFWQTQSATTLFTLTAPVGSIIDVKLSLIAQDDDVASAATAVTTGTLAAVYYLSLDPNATHRYTPISLTTTT